MHQEKRNILPNRALNGSSKRGAVLWRSPKPLQNTCAGTLEDVQGKTSARTPDSQTTYSPMALPNPVPPPSMNGVSRLSPGNVPNPPSRDGPTSKCVYLTMDCSFILLHPPQSFSSSPRHWIFPTRYSKDRDPSATNSSGPLAFSPPDFPSSAPISG